MPDVFIDEIGAHEFFITTTADWTVSSGGLPNGDNYVTGDGTVAATYDVNGDTWDLNTGDWTVEFWLYIDAVVSNRTLLHCASPGTSSNAAMAWIVVVDANERLLLQGYTTAGGAYMSRTTLPLASATWYHVAIVIDSASTPVIYLNGVASSAASTARTGTPRTPSSYYLYLGSRADGTEDITSGLRIAKVAIYNAELTIDQINEHILAMTAT